MWHAESNRRAQLKLTPGQTQPDRQTKYKKKNGVFSAQGAAAGRPAERWQGGKAH
jgi:hypothetical protein